MAFTTVTQGKWSVSCTTGSGINGATLNVAILRDKLPSGWKIQRGNCDGMHFASSDAAFKYAFEHGYLQRYYAGVACLKCRTVHTFLGHRSGFCHVHGEFCG